MYTIKKIDVEQSCFIDFINEIMITNWSLTANAYEMEPIDKPLLTRKELFKALDMCEIFVLKYCGCIISSIRVSHKKTNHNVLIFSHVETHPDYQKRGVFGRTLGEFCLREACDSVDCERVELMTWSFNRKGIPFYKRGGFRALPGTNLLMENYLPSIVKHPDTQPYFKRYDYIRTLQNERSYGYDAVDRDGISVFEYCWKPRKANDSLRVLVDWQKKEIVDIQCSVCSSFTTGA